MEPRRMARKLRKLRVGVRRAGRQLPPPGKWSPSVASAPGAAYHASVTIAHTPVRAFHAPEVSGAPGVPEFPASGMRK